MCHARKLQSATGESFQLRHRHAHQPETLQRRWLKTLKGNPNYLWASERAQKMSQAPVSKWIGPLCLPMLLVIQPLTSYYNLRTSVVLVLLSFILWIQYKRQRRIRLKHGHAKDGGNGAGSTISQCEKCMAELQSQLVQSVMIAANNGGISKYHQLSTRWMRRLPWRLISRQWGQLAYMELPPIVALVTVWLYAKVFRCRVEEAQRDRLRDYRSVGDFFCRRLKPEVRPISQKGALVSPADGTVTFGGTFNGGFLQQVKGTLYSINYFLGLDGGKGSGAGVIHASCRDISSLMFDPTKNSLYQLVIYLSPGDYHRFHSPTEWVVEKRRHFPGELLSVKPNVVGALPGLFHLNERVAWLGRWHHGFFAMVAVGATNVGSIHSEFEPEMRTNRPVAVKSRCKLASSCAGKCVYYDERLFEGQGLSFTRGQDFGHFSFGSTIVLLFEAPKNDLNPITSGRVLVGQDLFGDR